MIVHSSGSSFPGFVHDLLRDRDLAHVVQKRGELQVAKPLLAQPQLPRERERELNHASGVLAGVVIV